MHESLTNNMKKRKIIAFYDAVFFAVISSIMLTIVITILMSGKLENSVPINQKWYCAVIFAFCISFTFCLLFFIQNITIDLNCDKVNIHYLVNYARNDKDLHSNWIIYPSEIEKVSVVKLTKEEKRKYTSAKFLFSKYLKVEMKHGHIKYLYVSHYSNYQIKKIIKMLNNIVL